MNSVEEKDHGWERIKGEVENASSVKVGILSDSEDDDEGTDMLLIAAANEFGTNRIPARPFIRGAFDEHQSDLRKMAERLWSQVMEGRMGFNRALGLLGEYHEGQVKRYMTALDAPANAPSTVLQKGSSNPLIDEGRLRNSVRWELE